MSCQNCAGLSMPICGGPAVLICVRSATDAFPIPAWVTAVCELGAITGLLQTFVDCQANYLSLSGISFKAA